MRTKFVAAFVVFLMACGCACAAEKNAKQAFQNAKQPAWSVKGERQEFKVSVSPAGQVIGMIPRVGGALGTSVDYIVNEHYRTQIRDALGSYDLPGFVRGYLEERLKSVSPHGLRQVLPLISTAGFSNDSDAVKARLDRLRESGVDLLLDLKVQYGIYDSDFRMKFDIEGKLVDIQKKKRYWMGRVSSVGEPYLADVKFENAILKKIPYIHAPKLAADEKALERLMANDAALLKKNFEDAARGGISAALCEMGLADEALGHYFLGRKLFQKKKYDKAQEHLVRAVELDGSLIDARNDLSVTYARLGAPDKAMEYASKILADAPDYAPALFNLAWWNAFESKNAGEAKKFYDEAISKGVRPSKKLEKAIEKLGQSK